MKCRAGLVVLLGWVVGVLSGGDYCSKSNDVDCNNFAEKSGKLLETAGLIDESLNELDQEDPKLIEVIKNLIVKPSTEPYKLHTNFEKMKTPQGGQYNQVSHLAELFGDRHKGFFIEAGAFDGEFLSNTLYFEKKRNWTGLLVEPNPDAFKALKSKNRRSFLFGQCLSTKTTPEIVEFDACGLFGGIIHDGVKLSDIIKFDEFEDYKRVMKQRTIRVQCFPLFSILQALDNPIIDLFSLDIEGAELPVLKTLPWDKVNIRVLLLEVNHIGEVYEGSVDNVEKFLDDKGFKIYKNVEADNIYVRKDFKKA